jgi:hypothetical protein
LRPVAKTLEFLNLSENLFGSLSTHSHDPTSGEPTCFGISEYDESDILAVLAGSERFDIDDIQGASLQQLRQLYLFGNEAVKIMKNYRRRATILFPHLVFLDKVGR